MDPNLWRTAATLKKLLPVTEELGNCWSQLGIALDLSQATVYNIFDDYKFNTQRANEVLRKWIEKQGNKANMGRLAVVLVGIGKSDIVHKLLGTCCHQFVNQALA